MQESSAGGVLFVDDPATEPAACGTSSDKGEHRKRTLLFGLGSVCVFIAGTAVQQKGFVGSLLYFF